MASAVSIFCLIFICNLLLPSHSADPDSLQDFCVADLTASPSINGFPCEAASSVTSADFFSDVLVHHGNTSNAFKSRVTRGNVLAFPALNTLGISMNRVDLGPYGLNPPHSHPRATELGIVVKGKVLVGFVTTGNVFYSKVLTKGEMFEDWCTSKRMWEKGRFCLLLLSIVSCLVPWPSPPLFSLQSLRFQLIF